VPSSQWNFPAEQMCFGLKTPPDPHVDRSAQSLRKPWELALQCVTVPSVPSLRPCNQPPVRSFHPLMKPWGGSKQPIWGWKPPAVDGGFQ